MQDVQGTPNTQTPQGQGMMPGPGMPPPPPQGQGMMPEPGMPQGQGMMPGPGMPQGQGMPPDMGGMPPPTPPDWDNMSNAQWMQPPPPPPGPIDQQQTQQSANSARPLTAYDPSVWIMLALSIVTMVIGMVVAYRMKRY